MENYEHHVQPTYILFENYDKYYVLFVKVARSILLELLLNILTMTPLRE